LVGCGDKATDDCVEQTWYTDADGDGFGADEGPVQACEDPGGVSAQGGDCDDSSPEVHPAASEICNGIDDDCDGALDDDDASLDTSTTTTWYVDEDGDGYGVDSEVSSGCTQPPSTADNTDDCDDSRAEVNPAATEICDDDRTDEDCSGLADDEDPGLDTSTATAWYPDADGDGYETTTPDLACLEPGEGTTSEVGTDCDDADPDVHPDATEICNGVDDDCDGDLDDDDPSLDTSTTTTWYVDEDGDGYGVEGEASSGCSPPASTADNTDDCDDADDSIYLGAQETCEDGIDSNCDGRDTDCGVVPVSEVDGIIERGSFGTWTGSRLRLLGDLDGDGQRDLLVKGGSRTYIFQGLTTATASTDESDLNVHNFYTPAGEGDADGDGYADILGVARAGGAYTGAMCLQVSPVTSGASCTSSMLAYGTSIVPLGGEPQFLPDYDQDGMDEVLLPGMADSWFISNEELYVFTYSAFITHAGTETPDEHASFHIYADVAADTMRLGRDTAVGGDVDADGWDDLLVAGSWDDLKRGGRGQVFLLSGPITASVDVSVNGGGRASIVGETEGDLYGSDVCLGGDFDDDGYDDVAVGARLNSEGATKAGAVYLHLGPLSGELDADEAELIVYGEVKSEAIGANLECRADVDGDDAHDLLIGAQNADGDAPGSGVVYLFTEISGGTFTPTDADGTMLGGAPGEEAGMMCVTPDLDDDGLDDILVGAQWYDGDSADQGRVFIVLGESWEL